MNAFQNDFRSLVHDYLLGRGKSPSEVIGADDYLLDFDNRIVQLRLGENGTMLASTVVLHNEGIGELVLPGAIAEFNAYHMLAGGYCLIVEARHKSLYVEQELTIGRFDAEGLRQHLLEFTDRAATCTRWYLDQLEQSVAA